MTVQRILHEKGGEVTTVKPDATLAEVAAVLSGRRIGAVVVMDGEKVGGILSERDIVRALAAEGAAALERRARDYMTSKVMTCRLQDPIADVMQRMTAGRFRHLPVVENGRLVGIVSIGDVVKRKIEEVEHDAAQMRDYIATA
jgi:CBS domain-containing protein